MPPPAIAIRVMQSPNSDSRLAASDLSCDGNLICLRFILTRCDLGQRLDQCLGVVQALRAPQFQAKPTRLPRKRDVDVVKNLDVIAQKANRLHHHAGMAFGLNGLQRVFDSWANPRATAHPLALEGKV